MSFAGARFQVRDTDQIVIQAFASSFSGIRNHPGDGAVLANQHLPEGVRRGDTVAGDEVLGEIILGPSKGQSILYRAANA